MAVSVWVLAGSCSGDPVTLGDWCEAMTPGQGVALDFASGDQLLEGLDLNIDLHERQGHLAREVGLDAVAGDIERIAQAFRSVRVQAERHPEWSYVEAFDAADIDLGELYEAGFRVDDTVSDHCEKRP